MRGDSHTNKQYKGVALELHAGLSSLQAPQRGRLRDT